jgi:hypothetical protein
MGAGPVPEILHRALILCAKAVRLGIVSSLAPLAPLMHGAVNVLRWGEHRGGMFVALAGVDAHGRKVERSWEMIAEGDDGPFIPSMAAEAIVRRRLDGHRPAAGARAATRELELSDYEALFARRQIFSGVRDTPDPALPLYRRLLGDAYAALPAPIRAMHDLTDTLAVAGRASVERGTNPLARMIAAAVGFPPAGQDMPVTVEFTLRDGREVWRRDFAGRTFASTQEEGRGRSDRLLWSASARWHSVLPWCARASGCHWWCGAGVRSALRCRARSRRSAPPMKASWTAASISTSRSGCG